jgi:dTDP-4-amino-4,6-dideoxygalactose transaminase
MVGCNSRLDTIQAAILRAKLRNLNKYLQSRIEAGHRYNQLLESLPQIIKPSENSWAKHTYNQYVIRLSGRDKIKDLLKTAGVPTMVYYPSPLHLQKAYAYLGNKTGDFPVAEKLCHEVLALPIHTEMTHQEQKFVVNSLIQSINSL